MPFETFSAPEGEEKKYTRRQFLKKLTAGLALSPLGVPLTSAPSEITPRAPGSAPSEHASPKEKREQITQDLKEARRLILSKVRHYNALNGGLRFLNNIINFSATLELFLDTPEIKPQLEGPLAEIVSIYAGPLTQAKRYFPDLYKKEVDLFKLAMKIVRENPPHKVKPLLEKIFSEE